MICSASSDNLQAANQATLNAQKEIAEAKASAPIITISDLNDLLTSNVPFGLIDVRSESEYEAGYIHGAELITRSNLEFVIQKGGLGADDRKIIIYCRAGNRSALAIKTMLDLGFTDVRHLDGGFNAWVEAKLPFFNSLGKVQLPEQEENR